MDMKTLLKYIFIILFSSVLTLESCKEKDSCVIAHFTTISYGTSFGECVGYCIKTIAISDATTNFQKTAHNDKSTYPDFDCDDAFPGFETLKLEIDIAAFCAMEPVIGCPDCTDGGAEWVEISNSTHALRVTFEYNNAPEELSLFIENLRFYMQRMEASC